MHLEALITVPFITHPPNLRHTTGQQEEKGRIIALGKSQPLQRTREFLLPSRPFGTSSPYSLSLVNPLGPRGGHLYWLTHPGAEVLGSPSGDVRYSL